MSGPTFGLPSEARQKTPEATNAEPSTLALRDANGRAQVASPALAADIANKQYVDNAVASGGQDLSGYATTYWVTSTLNTYATQTWVEGKNYLTQSSLNTYATQAWVEGKGYLTAASDPNPIVAVASI
jgi:hypothetical protein